MKVTLPANVELRGPDGSNVSVDLSKLEMTDQQREALLSVYSKAMLERNKHAITQEEFDLISDLKSQLRAGSDVAFIVRFDWKWIRIDEPKRTLAEVVSEKD
jgi:hypothetical protein